MRKPARIEGAEPGGLVLACFLHIRCISAVIHEAAPLAVACALLPESAPGAVVAFFTGAYEAKPR